MMKSNNFLKDARSNNPSSDKVKKERLSEALRSNLRKRKVFQKKQKERIS